MEIKPVKQEYILSVANHKMRAVVLHEENARKLSYYFDDKLVEQKVMPGGDYYTDDECISEVVDEYKRNTKGVYADLLNRHIDKVHLVAKLIEVKLINFGIAATVKAKIVKNFYEVEITPEGGEDVISAKIKANNFSEAFEKTRILISTLEGLSAEASQNITLLSSDKIKESINWE